jgi:peptidoglycan/LPS O-acetylase OafA/YrhL
MVPAAPVSKTPRWPSKVQTDLAAKTRPRREALPALSGLRFFLAAHVLFFHFAPLFLGDSAFARNLLRAGSSSIAGFFLLSGFILTYAHVMDSDRIDQPVREFWLARVLRIYPAYFLAFLLTAPFALAQLKHAAFPFREIVKTGLFLSLLQTWVPGLWRYWNYPAWSLSVEAFFYAMFPLLVRWIFRPRWDWRIMLGAVWLSGLLVPIGLLGMSRFEWLLATPPLHLPGFVFGMILGRRLMMRSTLARQTVEQEPLERQPSNKHHPLRWMAPAAAVTLVVIYGAGWFPESLIDHGLLAPLMGCLMWGLAVGEGWFGRLLGSRPIAYLGEISYGIYIFQFPVFTACFVLTKRLGLPWNSRLTFLACCALLVCLSALSFELVEKPLRRAGMRRYARRPQTVASSISTLR